MQTTTPKNSPADAPKKEGRDRFVYLVQFFAAPFPSQPRQRVFFFSSLAAIFDLFSPEQVGCGLGNLYNLQIADGSVYCGKRCIIKRERVRAKRHKCP